MTYFCSRSPQPRHLGVAALCALIILHTAPAQADPPPYGPPSPAELTPAITLAAAAADNPLVVHALLENKGASSASRSVRLLLSGSKTSAIYMLATDLQEAKDPTLHIDRGDVSIPSGTSLTGELPHNLRITVSNIPRPGNYTGRLTFFVLGQTRPALEMQVVLAARARPDVVPVRATVNRHLVSCTNRLSCFLASYVLSDSVVSDELLLQLENKTREPVTIVDSALILRGEHTNVAVPHRVFSLLPALPLTLPANQVAALVLSMQRSQLPPDHYQGSLRLLVRDSDDPVSINLDLAVRHGPLLPMFVLLLGIGVGRLVQRMDSPEVQKQMKMMERYRALSDRAAEVENPSAVQFIARELERIKGLIESAKDSEETLQLAIDKTGALVELFFNIEQLEQRARAVSDNLRSEIKNAADTARKFLCSGQFPQAEAQRKTMEALLSDGRMGPGESALPFFDASHQLAVLQTAALAAADVAWRNVKRTLSFLSGLSTRSADVRYWLLRPLLSVALLLLLSFLGLQQLYVSAGTTFGATGLYDYLGLFVWGLSADIAQRSLHSLPGLSGR